VLRRGSDFLSPVLDLDGQRQTEPDLNVRSTPPYSVSMGSRSGSRDASAAVRRWIARSSVSDWTRTPRCSYPEVRIGLPVERIVMYWVSLGARRKSRWRGIARLGFSLQPKTSP